MKPQTAATLALLRANPAGITPFDAMEHVHSMRLGARVWELRAAGYDVRSELITTSSGKRVSRYTLHEAPEQLVLGVA